MREELESSRSRSVSHSTNHVFVPDAGCWEKDKKIVEKNYDFPDVIIEDPEPGDPEPERPEIIDYLNRLNEC
jgi:hypothetical protein